MFNVKVTDAVYNADYVKKSTGEKTGCTTIYWHDDSPRNPLTSTFVSGMVDVKAGDTIRLKVCHAYSKATNRPEIYFAFDGVVKG